jgi:1-acyl-sn-glycerol-3-phosphate acyltransferase
MTEVAERVIWFDGSALARTAMRVAGWRVRFDGLPARQGVAIIYPHTSNWDVVVGILAKWAIGIPVTFWVKDSVFRVPLFGRWMRWLGAMPVDRSAANGIVGQMADALKAARADGRFLWLALAPEGTRRLTGAWRSGFYQLALEARVPLALAFFDYRRREVGIERFLMLSGNRGADMDEIAREYGTRVGMRPNLAAPIRLER